MYLVHFIHQCLTIMNR